MLILELSQPPPDDRHPSTWRILGGWLIRAPEMHPVWDWYFLTVTHLRATKASLKRGCQIGRTHQIQLFAQHPDSEEINEQGMYGEAMLPANFSQQLSLKSDMEALVLLDLLVCQIAAGELPLNYTAYDGGQQMWEEAIASHLS